jgi:antitoxin component YwqK of YwqJK toxin-antitoxin module
MLTINSTLDRLIDMCGEYEKDEQYVYAVFMTKWLIVMKKIDNHNDEKCKVFDTNYAKYKTDRLMVVRIIDADNPNVCVDILKGVQRDYRVGHIITSQPDNRNIIKRLANIQSNAKKQENKGIVYFKTVVAAYYNRKVPKGFTGKWYEWYNVPTDSYQVSGQKYYETTYSDGMLHGLVKSWHKNGNLNTTCYYVNGKLTGRYTDLYDNGNVCVEGDYLDGQRVGLWTFWYASGIKCEEGMYSVSADKSKKGVKSGVWKKWYSDGSKEDEGVYVDGDKSGLWIKWLIRRSGFKDGGIIEGMYGCGGKKNGTWTLWYDGKKEIETVYKNDRKKKRIEWYPNGKKAKETYYDRTVDHDIKVVVERYEDESLKSETIYKNGKKISNGIVWDTDEKFTIC